VDASPTDAISAIKFSPHPNSTKLAAASWDKHVYLYEYIADSSGASECRQLAKFEHRAPVLDVCFGASDDELYTAGLDWDVRKYATVLNLDEDVGLTDFQNRRPVCVASRPEYTRPGCEIRSLQQRAFPSHLRSLGLDIACSPSWRRDMASCHNQLAFQAIFSLHITYKACRRHGITSPAHLRP
jgi:hypothetical protein